jgi:signal transduction histidine kinase
MIVLRNLALSMVNDLVLSLRRILENLCTNAIKYGGANTPVIVTLKHNSENAYICIHNERNTIPEIELGKLFGPFRRIESVINTGKRGWGLGLTLVKGLNLTLKTS